MITPSNDSHVAQILAAAFGVVLGLSLIVYAFVAPNDPVTTSYLNAPGQSTAHPTNG